MLMVSGLTLKASKELACSRTCRASTTALSPLSSKGSESLVAGACMALMPFGRFWVAFNQAQPIGATWKQLLGMLA